jgi:hypothetical protein
MDVRRDYDSRIFLGVKTRLLVCRGSNNGLPTVEGYGQEFFTIWYK